MVLEVGIAEMPISYTVFSRLSSFLIQVSYVFIQDRFHCSLNVAGEQRRKLIIRFEVVLKVDNVFLLGKILNLFS